MQKVKEGMKKSIFLLVGFPALIFTLLIFFWGCTHWSLNGTSEYINSDIKVFILSGVGILCLLVVGGFVQKIILKQKDIIRKAIYICMMLVIVGIQMYSCVRYQVLLGWDNTDTLVSAISIVSGQEELFQTGYFEMCPNQRCFLISTTSIVWLFRMLGFSYAELPAILSIISCICVDVAIYFVYLSVKELKEEEAAEKTLFWLLVNPGLIYWGIYYYTTNISILITVVTIWGILKIWKNSTGYVACFLLGMLAMFGFQYRPTLVIVFIAMAIMAVFGKYKHRLRLLTAWMAGLVVMYFLLQFAYHCFVPELDKEKQLPFTHWLMMGAQGVGELTEEDVYFTTSFPTYEEKKAATVEVFKSRIQDMGVYGYLRHAGRKIAYIWSYGDHGYHPEFQYYNELSSYIWGNKNVYFAYYQQMYYMTIVLFMIAGIVKCMKALWCKETDDMLFPIMIFVGAVLFYVLWEGDQYYGVAFWGVMQVCAADGMIGLGACSQSGKTRGHVLLCGALLACAAVLLWDAEEWNAKERIPVVSQTKVNDTLFFDRSGIIEQTFVAGQSFDTIDIWLEKEKRKEDSGAVYEIVLEGEDSGVIFEDIIYAQDILRTVEYVKNFDTVDIKRPERFSLLIRTIEDDPENRLGIPYYNLPVEVYQYGQLWKDGEQISADMRLQVYMSGK